VFSRTALPQSSHHRRRVLLILLKPQRLLSRCPLRCSGPILLCLHRRFCTLKSCCLQIAQCLDGWCEKRARTIWWTQQIRRLYSSTAVLVRKVYVVVCGRWHVLARCSVARSLTSLPVDLPAAALLRKLACSKDSSRPRLVARSVIVVAHHTY
jgi:hypothetical protein